MATIFSDSKPKFMKSAAFIAVVFLVFTGESDDPNTHADEFRRQMKYLGIESGLTVIKNAPHPFFGKQA